MHPDSPTPPDLNEVRVLLSGASGYVAGRLLPRLLEAGAEVVAQTRHPGALAAPADTPGVTILEGAPGDTEVANAIQDLKPELVFALAGRTDATPTTENRDAMLEEHVAYADTLATLVDTSALRRMVYTGSCAEYGNGPVPFDESQELFPNDPYARAKVDAVNLLRRRAEGGLPVCIVRPFVVYGPGQSRGLVHHVLQQALADAKFETTDGTQTRDLIWIGDLLDGLLAAAHAPGVEGEVINLGSGVETPVREVVETLCRVAGGGHPQFGAVELRPGEVLRSVAAVDKARALLGWHAEVDLVDGLTRTVEAARAAQSE